MRSGEKHRASRATELPQPQLALAVRKLPRWEYSSRHNWGKWCARWCGRNGRGFLRLRHLRDRVPLLMHRSLHCRDHVRHRRRHRAPAATDEPGRGICALLSPIRHRLSVQRRSSPLCRTPARAKAPSSVITWLQSFNVRRETTLYSINAENIIS